MLAALHVITLGAGNPATVGRSPRAVPLEGQLGVNFTNWHTKLRSELLQGYDVMSPPISNRAKNTNASDGSFSLAAKLSEAGADISLQLRVLKLDSVDLAGGPVGATGLPPKRLPACCSGRVGTPTTLCAAGGRQLTHTPVDASSSHTLVSVVCAHPPHPVLCSRVAAWPSKSGFGCSGMTCGLRGTQTTMAACILPSQTHPTDRVTIPDALPPAQFWSHPSDGHEIWVPDITTYNTRGSLADQVGAAWIDVYSDGSTFYSRAGNLDILCKFQGLVKFPFDRDVRRPLLASPALACRPPPTQR
eukprot:scaffold39983_cov58-Phaeocystis_antarctica.AAC.1